MYWQWYHLIGTLLLGLLVKLVVGLGHGNGGVVVFGGGAWWWWKLPVVVLVVVFGAVAGGFSDATLLLAAAVFLRYKLAVGGLDGERLAFNSGGVSTKDAHNFKNNSCKDSMNS